MKQRNLVAKHARTYNKAATHKDRKRALKRGYTKHIARKCDYRIRLTA